VSNRLAPDSPVAAALERCAARAEFLAASSSTAADPLRFAAGLYRAQGRLATAVAALHAEQPLTGLLSSDVDRLLDRLGDLLGFAAVHGPARLAERARARAREAPPFARSHLLAWWGGERGAAEDYLSRALLRPYVEVLARLRLAPDRPHVPGRCPFCGGSPWIAARRSESHADGARRTLGCALCGGEWLFDRIRCPACSEGDAAKLPSFRSETHPAARIESCETCRRYVKSIDLTMDGRAIPEVDDLLSLSMDLWAVGEGFARIEPGLAGVIGQRAAAGGRSFQFKRAFQTSRKSDSVW
jgi:Protein involved in formate dehydrogenase formation